MFTVCYLLLVTAAADTTCEVDQDGTCVSDFDDDFVSLAQLRATLARASGTSSESLDMEMDLTDSETLEGADATAGGKWTKVPVRNGKSEYGKMYFLWTRTRKTKKGPAKEFWADTRYAKQRTKGKGPKSWRAVKTKDVANDLKKLTDCFKLSGKPQFYCRQLPR
jgi:hypothetical protein